MCCSHICLRPPSKQTTTPPLSFSGFAKPHHRVAADSRPVWSQGSQVAASCTPMPARIVAPTVPPAELQQAPPFPRSPTCRFCSVSCRLFLDCAIDRHHFSHGIIALAPRITRPLPTFQCWTFCFSYTPRTSLFTFVLRYSLWTYFYMA